MEIGNIEFMGANRGRISFDRIHRDLCDCPLTVMKEPNINTEIYETVYDRPPSNAKFLTRKGFVHSKVLIKVSPTNNRSSMSMRVNPERATTSVKAIRGSQRFNRMNKRRPDALGNGAMGPPPKRLKAGMTLNEAIGELLYHGEKSLEEMRSVLTARTSITVSHSELQQALKEMGDLYQDSEGTFKYYLKEQHYLKVDWADSSVLTDAEKRQIDERGNGTQQNGEEEKERSASASVPELTPSQNSSQGSAGAREAEAVPAAQREFESKYAVLVDQKGYEKYSEAYTEKAARMKKLATSVKQNTDYFKEMRGLIKAEKDAEKKAKMTGEFRKVFNERKAQIKQMKMESARLSFELVVLKKRINTYVTQRQQRPAN